MKELQIIIIAGKTNTGKSTLMSYIQQMLLKDGFDVELSLEGQWDYKNEEDFHDQINHEIKRLEMIKNTKIILKEMYVNPDKPINNE
jgi:uncharacterized protein YhaN